MEEVNATNIFYYCFRVRKALSKAINTRVHKENSKLIYIKLHAAVKKLMANRWHTNDKLREYLSDI